MQDNDYDLVVIGGSAGSIGALMKIVPNLTKEFNIPIVIVLHRKASPHEGGLREILQNRSLLHVKEVDEKEPILSSTIYLAPADYHLLIEQDLTFSLDGSEKVHYSRPSIDVTFECAAERFGPKLVGILLTGANSDGAHGIEQIATLGGYTIAQDPSTAEVSTMPSAAIQTGKVKEVLSLEGIVNFLNQLVLP